MLLGIRDTSWLSMKRFLGNRGVKEEILNFDAHRIDPQLRAQVSNPRFGSPCLSLEIIYVFIYVSAFSHYTVEIYRDIVDGFEGGVRNILG